jgi:DNA-binding NtrC family response regulator
MRERLLELARNSIGLLIICVHPKEAAFFTRRLRAVSLRLPPLRKRPEDIGSFARFFWWKYSQIYNCPQRTIDGPTLREAIANDWPGNVSQLKRFLQITILSQARKHQEAIAAKEAAIREERQARLAAQRPAPKPLSPIAQRARMGGKAAHERGRAHEWTVEEAREAARKAADNRRARTKTTAVGEWIALARIDGRIRVVSLSEDRS